MTKMKCFPYRKKPPRAAGALRMPKKQLFARLSSSLLTLHPCVSQLRCFLSFALFIGIASLKQVASSSARVERNHRFRRVFSQLAFSFCDNGRRFQVFVLKRVRSSRLAMVGGRCYILTKMKCFPYRRMPNKQCFARFSPFRC